MRTAEPIHVAFGVNNSYAPYIAVTIKSIVENNRNSEVCIHVLTDRISDANLKRMDEAVGGYDNVSLNIYHVDDVALQGLKTGVWTIYTWYRILMPSILSPDIHKVLYLDADTLVTADLQELFSVDMTGYSVAAAIDVQTMDGRTFERCGYEPCKQYVCAGVLLINLDYWRHNGLAVKLVDWANRNSDRILFPDQDSINYVCRDTKIVLPLRFGILNAYFQNDIFYTERYAIQLLDCIARPVIVHYAGCYPWIRAFAVHPMQSEWEKYNRMLENSVDRVYFPRRWLFVKVILSKLLHHPFRKPERLGLDDIKRRLSEYDS